MRHLFEHSIQQPNLTIPSRRITVRPVSPQTAMPPMMSPAPGRQPAWIPNTNVFISAAGQLIVQVELCSMRSDNLEITVEGRKLRIAGHRLNPEFAAAQTVLVHEMHAGPFEAILELPSGYDLAEARASYLNGVLSIIVPNSEFLPPTSFR